MPSVTWPYSPDEEPTYSIIQSVRCLANGDTERDRQYNHPSGGCCPEYACIVRIESNSDRGGKSHTRRSREKGETACYKCSPWLVFTVRNHTCAYSVQTSDSTTEQQDTREIPSDINFQLGKMSSGELKLVARQ